MTAHADEPGEDRAFRTSARVRFAHCDPAGILFYPRAFELVNGAVEDWFEQALGCSFDALHREQGVGVPTVTLAAEFHTPARLGETLDLEVRVARAGGASVDLVIRASVCGIARFTVRPRLVFARLGADIGATPIPTALRARIAQALEPAS